MMMMVLKMMTIIIRIIYLDMVETDPFNSIKKYRKRFCFNNYIKNEHTCMGKGHKIKLYQESKKWLMTKKHSLHNIRMQSLK